MRSLARCSRTTQTLPCELRSRRIHRFAQTASQSSGISLCSSSDKRRNRSSLHTLLRDHHVTGASIVRRNRLNSRMLIVLITPSSSPDSDSKHPSTYLHFACIYILYGSAALTLLDSMYAYFKLTHLHERDEYFHSVNLLLASIIHPLTRMKEGIFDYDIRSALMNSSQFISCWLVIACMPC